MATGIPDYYLDGTPGSTQGLSPLQLALAEILRKGTDTSLFVNPEFLSEMQKFTNSTPLVPLNVLANYGQTSTWDWWNGIDVQLTQGYAKLMDQIVRITATRIITIGDQIFVQRVAQDCGPDEAIRYELVEVAKRSEAAEGSFAIYGKTIYSGPVAAASDSGGSTSW